MSTSGSTGGCKQCKRKSKTPAGPPGSTVGHNGNGGLFFDTAMLETIIMNNFDGELSDYCAAKVREKIQQDINQALSDWANDDETSQFLCFDSQKPDPPCYELRLSQDYTIEAECKCNNDDIAKGKGPPDANVSSSKMKFVANPSSVPCDPPPNAPPSWAEVSLYC